MFIRDLIVTDGNPSFWGEDPKMIDHLQFVEEGLKKDGEAFIDREFIHPVAVFYVTFRLNCFVRFEKDKDRFHFKK